MSVLIGLLTTVLVLNCFFLVLLILIQLPKKESGSGLAFGGGTLDMALGAGAGNFIHPDVAAARPKAMIGALKGARGA